MNELVNTRHNLQIDPHLHIWGWEVGVYLFLGGLVAGMMIISGYLILTKRSEKSDSAIRMIPMAALIALSLGMFSLFLDLEHKLFVWRMYTTFQWTAPMSWGSWILLLVYPIIILTGLLWPPVFLKLLKIKALDEFTAKLNKNIIAYFNIGIGAGLGIYTGILLSAFVARPAWNSAMLWMLFLVSGLSTAAAFIHLVGKSKEESHFLEKADNFLLGGEILVLFLLFVGFASSTEVQNDALKLFMGGEFTVTFWVFVVGMGLVVPLILQIMTVAGKIRHTKFIPVFVLLGGLILRLVIVAAGQASHWSTAVFK